MPVCGYPDAYVEPYPDFYVRLAQLGRAWVRHLEALDATLPKSGAAMTRMALLFVFGTVLFALATRRMEAMQGEAVGRPMRSFALGVVGLLISIVAVLALSVTVVGIPVAIVLALLAVFAVYSGICAVLACVGAMLVRHKSENPYVHLAVGVGLYFLLGWIPYLGGLLTLALVLVSIGVVVATRGAGYLQRHSGNGPYRSVPA